MLTFKNKSAIYQEHCVLNNRKLEAGCKVWIIVTPKEAHGVPTITGFPEKHTLNNDRLIPDH